MFFDEGIKFIHDDKLLIFIKKRPFQYAITPHTARSELVIRVPPPEISSHQIRTPYSFVLLFIFRAYSFSPYHPLMHHTHFYTHVILKRNIIYILLRFYH